MSVHTRRIATVVALVGMTHVGSAIAAPTISEYKEGIAANAAPLSIATGPDGNLWFSQDGGTGALDMATPAGVITSVSTAATKPLDIATGPDGKLWFTVVGPSKLGTFSPLTEALEYTLTPTVNLEGLVAGPESTLWVVVNGPKGEVLRFVPPSVAPTRFAVPEVKADKPAQITVGSEGDLWFTENGGPGAIGRLNPATKAVTEYLTPTNNGKPAGITTGPEGDIWFTEAAGAGRIGRLIPATGEISEYSEGLTMGAPEGIAAGSDGNLYFTESAAKGALGRITPAGVITEYTTANTAGLTEYSKPWGIASGPDGNVWFTESANPARVGRLTVAPSVAAQASEDLTAEETALSAQVGANAQATSYFFEYGPTSGYGSATVHESAGSAGAPARVSATVSGLTPGARYHYRAVASNASGTTYGPDATFTVAGAPSASTRTKTEVTGAIAEAPLLSAGGRPTPVPVMGRQASIGILSGAILVRLAGSRSFVALSGAAVVPIGSVIDATRGVLELVTAINSAGATQSATIWGGVFQVMQTSAGHGMTNLILTGAPLKCSPRLKAHASSARSRRPKSRSIWAEDKHGRYSTHGANSVATVLGTRWETVDTCAGTLTRVTRGRVRVRSLHGRSSVIVAAGHSFLARP
jgi:streptogramin lyase